MAKKKFNSRKQLSPIQRGDTLIVKLVDGFFNTLFEAEVSVRDKRKMIGLMDDLNLKGVSFPKERMG